jgi:aspartyl-tRNA(Asn)/glutamyl-tRNA(Gln) amidotransferase subunit A
LESLGHQTRKIHFKRSADYYSSWKTIRLYEAAKVHTKHLQKDSGQISEDVKKMLIEGSRIGKKDYQKAKSMVHVIKKYFDFIFKKQCDLLLLPTVPILAPKLRQIFIGNNNDNNNNETDDNKIPIRDLLLRNTIVFNSIGFPALNIPVNRPIKDEPFYLPVGLQLVSTPSNQRILKMIGEIFEKILWQTSTTHEPFDK